MHRDMHISIGNIYIDVLYVNTLSNTYTYVIRHDITNTHRHENKRYLMSTYLHLSVYQSNVYLH